MKTYAFVFILFSILLFGCSRSKKEKLLGVWKGIKLENTMIDSFFIKSQHLIDTIGKVSSPEKNFELYGTWNMDSLRKQLQTQHDSALLIQNNRILNTIFQFNNDKIAYLTFDGNVTIDTARWNFDDEGFLLLEDLVKGGNNAMKRMEILLLNDSLMQLKIWNNNDSSKITFRHNK